MATHNNRVLLRLAFLVFCLGPTLFVVGLAGRERLWGRNTFVLRPTIDDAEHALRRVTGFAAKVGAVEALRRGVTRLSNVLLADPETGKTIARLPQIDLALTADGLVVITEDVQLERLQPLVASLTERAVRGGAPDMPKTRISSSLLTLHEAELTLRDWALVVEPGHAEMQFGLVGQEPENFMHIKINRLAGDESFKTRVRLETGRQSIPCLPWFGLFPFLKPLGEQSAFTGIIWMEESGHGWTGEMEGRLEGVNLDRLVSSQFPHKFSGVAQLHLTRCVVREGRVVEMAGSLQAGPGVISQSLLEAAMRSMKFEPSQLLAERPPAEFLRYTTCNAAFALTQNGLDIAGRCDERGTLMVFENPEVRLYDAPQTVAAIADVVRMLAPDSDLQIPVTQETNRLLRVLPAPPAKAKTDQSGAPRAHVRLGDAE